MRTQVCIIGGGPSGLLLSQLLHKKGIETIVLEHKTRDYVLGRIRAGILEVGMVNLMREAGVVDRLDKEGYVHDGAVISYGDDQFGINFREHTDTSVVVYGQTEGTRDLYDAREARGGQIVFNTEGGQIHDANSDAPFVTYTVDGREQRIDCDYVAGCDGFHGVSRQTIPLDVRKEYEKIYPFGWLGILSETPPVHEELIYAGS
ncbi:MAG: FAD-dependent monooxygenase, partial [Pelagimonas sp.]|nr:FAD-dependent monooxygenase [Pelagimonas sp.]